jgi:DNA-binding transcriptional LysR family regulator
MADQPWDLDTRHLAALDAIARTRSVSRAAEELGYGQSAVSQQLAALERIVGQRLVDRGTGPRPVTLTEPGRVLLSHARAVLERLDSARAELAQLSAGESGTVRLGVFQSAGARLLPRVLAEFRRRWPGITVSIENDMADDALPGRVRSGALDVAFVELSTVGPGFDHAVLMEDRFVAMVPPGHPLAARARVSVADFRGEDLVGGRADDTCTIRGEQAMRAAGFEPRIVVRTEDNATRQRLVDAGVGCAVSPGLTVEAGLTDGAVVVPLEEDIHRTIALAWSAERTPSAALLRFIDVAREAVGRAPAPSDRGD